MRDAMADVPISFSPHFSLDTSVPSISTLSVITHNLVDEGVYTLVLRAFYSAYPGNYFNHEFEVELINPCRTATLTIDATHGTFKVPNAVTLTQFVNYAPLRL